MSVSLHPIVHGSHLLRLLVKFRVEAVSRTDLERNLRCFVPREWRVIGEQDLERDDGACLSVPAAMRLVEETVSGVQKKVGTKISRVFHSLDLSADVRDIELRLGSARVGPFLRRWYKLLRESPLSDEAIADQYHKLAQRVSRKMKRLVTVQHFNALVRPSVRRAVRPCRSHPKCWNFCPNARKQHTTPEIHTSGSSSSN